MPRKTYITAEQMADKIADGRVKPFTMKSGDKKYNYNGDVFYSTISGLMDYEYGKRSKIRKDGSLFSEICRILEQKHKFFVHS